MINLNEKIILKKRYFNLYLEHFTEEQYIEYLRAVVNYSLYGKCIIKTPVVYTAFMHTKHDIDQEKRVIQRNQENTKYKGGRKKSVTTLEILNTIQNNKIVTYEGLAEHFGVCKETIKRRIREIDDVDAKRQILSRLRG